MKGSVAWHGYQAYGLTLASQIPLAELPDDDWRQATLRITAGPSLEGPPGTAAHDDGSPVVERTAAGLVLEFEGAARFVVSPDGGTVEVRTRPGVAESSLNHLLIDTVLPTVLSERGELVVHASGVALGGGAVLFVGPSGAGKSTLAAVLAQRGWPVLCDDAARIVVDDARPAVVPSYAGLRLWPDGLRAAVGPADGVREVASNSTKVRWVPQGQPADSVHLACICLFEDGEGTPEAIEAPPRDALRDLVANSYRVPGLGRDQIQEQFDRAAQVVQTTPLYRLFFPYDFGRLAQLAELVESLSPGTAGATTSRSA